jgi:hypothetical protein
MADRPYSAKDEQKLMTEIWDPAIADDPLAFVMFVFPWGKKGTPLENFSGPRKWQREELTNIKNHIAENKRLMAQGKSPLVYKSATASGRGPGKSALVAMLNLWMMSTRLGSTCINTANTEAQLKSRTWAELGKWHTLSLNSHWFDRSALSLKPADWFESALKKQLKVDTGYYYSSAQLWSEENPDAFAGVHNHNGILVIFDEASGIPAPIWKVTEGFFTEPVLDRYHFAFSNPRRNTGEFFECFHRHRNYWRRRNLDSRTVEGTDHTVLQQIVDKYGEDSDEARIEVKGQFPRQGDKQFIARYTIEMAVTRELDPDDWAPLIMGVDPARFGDDCTVIRFRQGRNARIIPPIKLKGADNMQVANTCADLIQRYNPEAVCIDAGNGTGIIDRLREMGYKVHEVWFGSSSPEPEYADLRTYMWAQMREWLKGGCIDNDQDLIDDLSAPEYKFQGTSDRMRLESKEQLKRRGFSSPDNADALACTFSVKVARRDLRTAKNGLNRNGRTARDVDYPIFG